MTLEAALRSFLISNNDVFNITANHIFVGEAPINSNYPQIVILKVGDIELDEDVSKAYEELLQVTCRAEQDEYNDKHGYRDASNLADIVRYALRSQVVRNTQWTDSDDVFHIINVEYRGNRILRDGDIYDSPIDFAIKYTEQ